MIQDIRTTIARRFPRAILVWPVPVQGEAPPRAVAAAIAGFDARRRGPPPRPDVLIVARGGGSLEDLMAFNEEIVVRAAAASRDPADLGGRPRDRHHADRLRLRPPGADAHRGGGDRGPARADLLADLQTSAARLVGGLHRLTLERAAAADGGGGRCPTCPASSAPRASGSKTGRAAGARAAEPDRRKRATLNRLAPRLPHPREQIAAKRAALAMLEARAAAAWHRTQARRHGAPPLARFAATPVQALVREKRARLEGLAARLEGVSYHAVLSRGFALVQDAEGPRSPPPPPCRRPRS